jgi:hypothetical protein
MSRGMVMNWGYINKKISLIPGTGLHAGGIRSLRKVRTPKASAIQMI